MDYTPHTEAEIQAMLDTVGLGSLEELFVGLPETMRNPRLDLPAAMDEAGLVRHLKELAGKNSSATRGFLGGGLRSHFIPAVAPALIGRSEFLTAYTPYQPEVSQGVLQAIFEYQTMIAELTGLDVSNASMYDGSSALAEGVLLALRHTGRDRVVVSEGLSPAYRQVLGTYLHALDVRITTLPPLAEAELSDAVGVVVAQNPNFLGGIERLDALSEAAHRRGALFLVVADPLSLALLRPPGAYGADIAVGEGQPLGNPMNFGGPQFGYLAVGQALVRQLPGRLVGQTVDIEGNRGYVLVLSTREQHIRRGKARSNITTNAQLAALLGACYLAALGPEGLREAALRAVANAHLLVERLEDIRGVSLVTTPPFFNEFVVRLPRPADKVRRHLAALGLHASMPLGGGYPAELALFAATELHDEDDLDRLTAAVRGVLA